MDPPKGSQQQPSLRPSPPQSIIALPESPTARFYAAKARGTSPSPASSSSNGHSVRRVLDDRATGQPGTLYGLISGKLKIDISTTESGPKKRKCSMTPYQLKNKCESRLKHNKCIKPNVICLGDNQTQTWVKQNQEQGSVPFNPRATMKA